MPIELEVHSLRIALDERLRDRGSFQHRHSQLEKLDEVPAVALQNLEAILRRHMNYYDSKVTSNSFMPHDMVLLSDRRFEKVPCKLQIVAVIEGFSNGSMQLEDFEGTRFAIRINGNGLRLYYT